MNRIFVFLMVSFLGSYLTIAQTSSPSPDSETDTAGVGQTETDKKNQDLAQNLADARKALKFGIDQTVVGVIKQATTNKDNRLVSDIDAKLDSLNPDVQKAALDYFVALKDFSSRPHVLQLLGNYNDADPSVVVAFLKYIQEAGEKADVVVMPLLFELVDNSKQDIQVAAIDSLAKLGNPTQIDMLIKLMKKSGTSLPVRAAVLRSFGYVYNDAATGMLKDIASNSAEDKTLRYEAITAIGKTGDGTALSILTKSIRSPDLFERGATIGALTGYPVDKVLNLYQQALKDPYWRNRVNVISAIGQKKIVSFVEAVSYMALSDPERPVQMEAYRTLALLDSADAWQTMKTTFEDEKAQVDLRALSAELIISEHFSPFKDSISTVMQKQWNKTGADGRLLEIICLELSRLKDAGAADLYVKMLSHPSQTIKLYGIRGIQTNSLITLYPQLQTMLDANPAGPVKAAIQDVLSPTASPKK